MTGCIVTPEIMDVVEVNVIVVLFGKDAAYEKEGSEFLCSFCAVSPSTCLFSGSAALLN